MFAANLIIGGALAYVAIEDAIDRKFADAMITAAISAGSLAIGLAGYMGVV